jgi:hypothetical protein
VKGKRRLPLVSSGPEVDEHERPRWQWVAFGAMAIFVVWLPLSAITGNAAARWAHEGALDARRAALFSAAAAIALAVASCAGGFTIGKWGPPRLGAREGALAGLAAAAVAIAGSALSFGFVPGSLLVAAVMVPFAALGGRLGRGAR